MADDINNNEGMGEAGDAGMPDDLKRLLARAEQGEDGDPDAYNPDADDDEEEDDAELEESFGEVDRGASAGEDINGGQLQISEFGREMKQSFIEYSMSVITARALPDVRDGLKPVHRRILYAMNESGIYPNRPHKKSAWTVGEVIGKYHPHGDSAVYEAMVRLAQWFSMRTPLIDGHGNFGNIDGDGAAAMRYTESRLAKPAMELLRDLQKDTVDWQPNYDESLQEPQVLPARFPNLLVNGSSGIAVGMATNIPPHNLGEAVEATCMLIDNPDATVDELMTVMPGPDFPTGAVIMGTDGIREAYETGRGSITVRAKAHVETTKTGRSRLVFTEIPYQVNKGALQEKIAQLVNEKRIEGVSDMRDESNQKGIRLVIELKKDIIPQVVLNNLYKFTQLQTTFGVNNLALVHGVPKCLSLREILQNYIEHQVEVVTRRTRFDLKKAQARAHILEGYLMALDNIDEVIHIIRSAYDDAKQRLMDRFKLDDVQAQAILDMRLKALQGLDREKLQSEYDELEEKIKYYLELLADENKLKAVLRSEMIEIRDKFGDKRKTEIQEIEDEIDIEDLIEEETCAFTLSNQGYIKRMPVDTYRTQSRGGRGVNAQNLKEEDYVKSLTIASTHDHMLFFTDQGRVHHRKGYQIPEAGRTARGTAIVNVLPLNPGESVTAMVITREFDENEFLMMVTRKGTVKRIPFVSLKTNRKAGIRAITLDEDDHLINVIRTNGDDDIVLATAFGYAICFNENDVRCMGRDAAGVRGIMLTDGDYVVGAEKAEEGKTLLTVTQNGYGKRTALTEYLRTGPNGEKQAQSRGGKGLKNYNITPKTGNVAGCRVVSESDDVMLIENGGVIIRIPASSINVYKRDVQGVIVMRIDDGNQVVSLERVEKMDEEETGEQA